MSFVASDLEGTLTTGETWKGVGRYMRRHGRGLAYRAFLLSRLPGVLAAKVGLADRQAVRDSFIVGLARLFRGLPRAQIEGMAEWVVEKELWPKRREMVLREVEAHAEAGRQVVLAAGGYQPVLDAFARRIEAEAVGTPLEFSNGEATGGLLGDVNTGPAKAERLREFLGTGELRVAYGDTMADVGMLVLSENPVAVCPDPGLRKKASEEGWRILGDKDSG